MYTVTYRSRRSQVKTMDMIRYNQLGKSQRSASASENHSMVYVYDGESVGESYGVMLLSFENIQTIDGSYPEDEPLLFERPEGSARLLRSTTQRICQNS